MTTTASGVHAEEATTNGDGDGRRAMDGTPDMTGIRELVKEVRAGWTEVMTEWADLQADLECTRARRRHRRRRRAAPATATGKTGGNGTMRDATRPGRARDDVAFAGDRAVDEPDDGTVVEDAPDVGSADDAGEAYWVFEGDPADAVAAHLEVDGDPADGVDDGDLGWSDDTSDSESVDDGTPTGDEVAHDAPHGEPAEDAGEAHWDFEGDPADAVDDGDSNGNGDISDGGEVVDGTPAGDPVEDADLKGEVEGDAPHEAQPVTDVQGMLAMKQADARCRSGGIADGG